MINELDYNSVPKNFGLCLNAQCKRADKCLRYQASKFIPEDTIVLSEMDAILSMTPAAIHVVTACRGYGIPAFLSLEENGIRMEGNSLVNQDGLRIEEIRLGHALQQERHHLQRQSQVPSIPLLGLPARGTVRDES